ncbi:MAG: hypothetical protein J6J23_07095 [Clostridia bacterium]|nr:hypothetical protein [Clostridia bacterium]
MIRGTTAQFNFKLPYNFSDLEVAQIVFWQPYNDGPTRDRPLPISKVLEQCQATNDPKELRVTLTQEETLRFSEKRKAYTQLRARGPEGQFFASKKHMITVYPVYDDNIMGDEILPTPTADGWVILDGQTIE